MVPSPLQLDQLQYPKDWMEEMASKDMNFYYEFETLRDFSKIENQDFKEFLNEC